MLKHGHRTKSAGRVERVKKTLKNTSGHLLTLVENFFVFNERPASVPRLKALGVNLGAEELRLGEVV